MQVVKAQRDRSTGNEHSEARAHELEQVLEQTEEYVRENPTQSVLCALAAGFIIDRLPIGRIVGGVLRLAFIAFKPAILVYGATKLYQAAQRDEY